MQNLYYFRNYEQNSTRSEVKIGDHSFHENMRINILPFMQISIKFKKSYVKWILLEAFFSMVKSVSKNSSSFRRYMEICANFYAPKMNLKIILLFRIMDLTGLGRGLMRLAMVHFGHCEFRVGRGFK